VAKPMAVSASVAICQVRELEYAVIFMLGRAALQEGSLADQEYAEGSFV